MAFIFKENFQVNLPTIETKFHFVTLPPFYNLCPHKLQKDLTLSEHFLFHSQNLKIQYKFEKLL